jgi:hypothetical protein
MAQADQVAAGQDISFGIHLDGAREPLSMRCGPNENEQTGGAQFLALTVDASTVTASRRLSPWPSTIQVPSRLAH